MPTLLRVDVVLESRDATTPAIVNVAHIESIHPHWSRGSSIVFHGDRPSLHVTASLDAIMSALYATNGRVLIKTITPIQDTVRVDGH